MLSELHEYIVFIINKSCTFLFFKSFFLSVLNLELLLFWQEEGRHRRDVKHVNNMALTAGFLVNVSSVRNKTDELQANVRRLHEHRGPSEPWLGMQKSTNTWIPPSIISCGPPPTLKKTAKKLQSYDFSKQSSFTVHTSPFYLDFF